MMASFPLPFLDCYRSIGAWYNIKLDDKLVVFSGLLIKKSVLTPTPPKQNCQMEAKQTVFPFCTPLPWTAEAKQPIGSKGKMHHRGLFYKDQQEYFGINRLLQ